MRALSFALLVLVATLVLPGPALAHKLKVFVAVEGGDLYGYAFFVGGGRAKGVAYRIDDASGTTVHEGVTDDDGGFRWPVSGPGDYGVTVNAGDGHGARATVAQDRFIGGAAPDSAAEPVAPQAVTPASDMVPADAVESLVAAAVQKEIVPLLERIEEMDNRLRLTDLVSGIFLILGAAGGLLWLTSRRRQG